MSSTTTTAERFDDGMDDRVPVTVLTGFLGSGKTTLLNRILTELPGERIAVIENEFAEIGIDDALLVDAAPEIVRTSNGRICCSGHGDLIRILDALLHREHGWLDRIVLETTGLARPAAVAQAFFRDDRIRSRVRLDAVVTLVDARHAAAHLSRAEPGGPPNEADDQIAFADRIVLNKTDLVTRAGLCELSAHVRARNALAPIVTAAHAKVDLDFVLGTEAFDLSQALARDPAFLSRAEHHHDRSVCSVGIDLAGELDPDRVEQWMRELLAERGGDIFRSKGVLALADHDSSWVFQGVHRLLDTERGRPWAAGEPRRSRMVFIGRNLDPGALDDGLRSCLAAAADIRTATRLSKTL